MGVDIATALGYSNTRDAIAKHIDNEDKATVAIHDGRQKRNITAINESGLYSLILSSELPSAKAFKRWVTSEVLPSIRKNGGYIAGQEIGYIELPERIVLSGQNREVIFINESGLYSLILSSKLSSTGSLWRHTKRQHILYLLPSVQSWLFICHLGLVRRVSCLLLV